MLDLSSAVLCDCPAVKIKHPFVFIKYVSLVVH